MWDDTRIARMRQLWVDGHSASHIAADLDCGISRNAVIGKLHRLGLQNRSTVLRQPRPQPERRPRPAPKPPVALMKAFPLMPVIVTPLGLDESVLALRRISVLDLTERMCKFPLSVCSAPEDTLTTLFCGEAKPDGSDSPYCSYHHRISFTPVTQRVRKKGPLYRNELRIMAR